MWILAHLGLSTIWLTGFWTFTRHQPNHIWLYFNGMASMMICIVLCSPALWVSIANGYPNDSFWTLSIFGQFGVLVISGTGIIGLFLALTAKTNLIILRGYQSINLARLFIDVALGLFCFSVIYSVSPQVFYLFYRQVFENLPLQWVIDSGFDLARLRSIAVFTPNGRLSDHLAGVVFWAIVPFTLWLHLRRWTSAKRGAD